MNNGLACKRTKRNSLSWRLCIFMANFNIFTGRKIYWCTRKSQFFVYKVHECTAITRGESKETW